MLFQNKFHISVYKKPQLLVHSKILASVKQFLTGQ